MNDVSSSPTRRRMLAGSAAVGAASILTAHLAVAAAPVASPGQPSNQGEKSAAATEDNAIRPFRFNASDEALADLHGRVAGTKWPSRELVTDASQGVQRATLRELAHYWQTEYDWRKFETRLNALPQFMTTIDGVDIHFIHVRSKNPNALPVIVTHGWPGSIIEELKIIEPLTNPTAHGASASDAFDIVIPSLPGYGFSAAPTVLGWDPIRIARAWTVLMQRLGYFTTTDWPKAGTSPPGSSLGCSSRRCGLRSGRFTWLEP